MAIVEIDRVKKSYGSLEIIHGVNIRIDDGEFVVLVGPSGCGKSTLLRMTAGLENISGGEIRIGHNVVNDLPPKDRDIAMVFQNYALYPHMTVGQNMGFSLKLRKTPSAMIDAKVKEAADILGLRPLLDRYPRQLSGGQRQRVAMGRAIVRDPQVFLFDEPLSNLDAKLRVQMRAEIKALHQRLHTTTIYVTCEQIEAVTMADKIVVMLDGHVEQIGAPLEVYDHPDSQFVAGFIGSPAMNFLSGRIETSGGASVVTKDGARIPASGFSRISNGQEVTLGIRPEHLEVVPPETAGAFTGEIQVVEPTGSETMISANVAGAQMVAVLRSRHRFQAGERIGLRPEPGRIHLFDPTTERGLRIK